MASPPKRAAVMQRIGQRCHRGIDWPVIVLCPSVDEGARREARAFGAHFLLNMPVDAQALFDAIAWVTEDQG